MRSRYKNTPTTNIVIDGQRVSSTWVFTKSLYNGNEIFHTVTAGEANRPDIISYTYYDSVQYWPYLLLYNNIKDPFFGIQAGDIIRVPVDRYKLVSMLKHYV